MKDLHDVETFLHDYANAVSTDDFERVSDSYAPVYIEAGPTGNVSYTVDDGYRAALRSTAEAMRGIGFRTATITAIDSLALDRDYVLSRTTWHLVFEKSGSELRAHFEQSYLVSLVGDDIRIICYLSHADQQEELQKLGLV